MAFWGPFLGGLAGGAASFLGQTSANQANLDEAERNRKFQESMSSTAHQREVKDLVAAGLNPILSAGGGASAPSGSMASVDNAVGPALTSAQQALTLKREMEQTDSQIALNEAAGEAQRAAAARDQTTAKESQAKTNLLNKQLPAVEAESKLRKDQAEFDQKYIKPRNINKLIQEGLGTINSAKDALLPGI